MSTGPTPDLAQLLDDCKLGVELHRLAVANAQHLAKLLTLGQSMQQVVGMVMHELCHDNPQDATQYLQALKEQTASTMNVLLLYVTLQSRETKNPKA